jgi:hypothetical protein
MPSVLFYQVSSFESHVTSDHILPSAPLANSLPGPTHKTALGLAKHGTTQLYTGSAVTEGMRTYDDVLCPNHTNPNQGRIWIVGLRRTVMQWLLAVERINWGSTHLWDPAPFMIFRMFMFIGSNDDHREFQRPELQESISEEAQNIWAKTLNLHVKRSKGYGLMSSGTRSCNNQSHLVVRKTQRINFE